MKQGKTVPRAYITLILLFIYVPMIFVALYSFNESKSIATWGGFTLSWYKELLGDRNLVKALQNSLEIAVCTTLLSAVLGTLGAVGFRNMHGKLKPPFMLLVYAPLVVPELVMALALLAVASLLPVAYDNNMLVIAHSMFCVPYVFMMVNIRLEGMDPSLEEAARDLGASRSKAFLTITLPLLVTAIASGSLLAFAMSMDDVIISSFLSGPSSQTLPVKVYSMLKLGVTPEINALSTIILLVVLGIFAIFVALWLSKRKD